MRFVLPGLAGKVVKVFPRHNWCGADVTLDRLGLLAATHQFLQRGFIAAFGMNIGCSLKPNLPMEDIEAAELDTKNDEVPLDDMAAYRAETTARKNIVSRFLSRSEAVQDLILQRLLLEPQAQLMQSRPWLLKMKTLLRQDSSKSIS